MAYNVVRTGGQFASTIMVYGLTSKAKAIRYAKSQHRMLPCYTVMVLCDGKVVFILGAR